MKTSHEMAQSVLSRQKKILHRRRAVFTAFGATAGVGVIAAAFTLSMTLSMSKGVDLVNSSTPGNTLSLPDNIKYYPLDLLGFMMYEKGKYHILTDNWQVSDDFDLFREYFFGTWKSPDKTIASELVIDDSEKAFLVNNTSFRFQEFYIVSDNVLAFVVNGNAESELFWLDTNYPYTMYYEPLNGDCLYQAGEKNHKTAVYTKTDEPVNTPENNFLSIYKLREISRDRGIDMDMLLNIEYTDKTSGEKLLHDDWYQFYPVYLVSEKPDRLVLYTTLGNAMTDTEKADVSYTIEKVDGVWTRTEEIGINTDDDVLGINDDVISELGMTFRELADKYGCEPKGAFNSYSIENGYGRYCWKSSDGSVYEDMKTAGGCNMIDGVKLSDLFSGISYPVSYDDLVEEYGFTLVEAGTEKGMDDCYWSTFEIPGYDNILCNFYTREYNVIEEDMSCWIMLKNAGAPDVDILSTEDGIRFQETAYNAAEAYLRNDKERLSEYLSDPGYDAGLSENSENLFDQLDHSELILTVGSITEFETGTVYPVIYKFMLAGRDMYFNLDMGLIKTDSGWKVEYICLQG